MVKLGKKWLTLLVAALLTLGTMALFTACGPTDPDTPDTPDDPDTPPVEEVIDWSSYTVDQFKAEDFDGKTISYQYTGVETQMNGQVLLNLYEDGSACAVHQASTSHNRYYGYWSEAEDEDGNAIPLNGKWTIAKDLDIFVYWDANPDTKYVINHYTEDLNGGGYTKVSTENLYDFSDKTIIVNSNHYEGFTPVEASKQITIAADGSTVVDFY